jgi:hypothetical protein
MWPKCQMDRAMAQVDEDADDDEPGLVAVEHF